jgi:integrase
VVSFDTLSEDDMSKSAAHAAVGEQAPTIESGTVVQFPARQKQTEAANSEPRRQYLTEREVDLLCEAARKRGRYGHRDATMVLIAYRHGLRVSELVAAALGSGRSRGWTIAGSPAQGK